MLSDGDEVYLNTGQLANAIQINSASINLQNGRYVMALSGAPGGVSDTSSGSGAKNAGGTGDFPIVKAASVRTPRRAK